MKKSNIFAYIELTKLVNELNAAGAPDKLKQTLRAQSAYFNILESKYFSDELIPEWDSLVGLIKQKGAGKDEYGRIISSPFANTIGHLSDRECSEVVNRLNVIHSKVKNEFR